ncbi:MAG: adenylate/guanylate cyclase domain-containing protein [Candidatus Electrothrix scaldis]|nr:MAG: adenylate/guanylate cyclase domain-containing protein [Candidatus Electrothrix sp. GW3-3]
MKKSWFSIFRNFPFTLTIIILVATGVPALIISYFLIDKNYQTARGGAIKGLNDQAKSIALDLTNQLNGTASRLRILGRTGDMALASYSELFGGDAAEDMGNFNTGNDLVASTYLFIKNSNILNNNTPPMEVVPDCVADIKLPSAVMQSLNHFFQEDSDTMPSQYIASDFCNDHQDEKCKENEDKCGKDFFAKVIKRISYDERAKGENGSTSKVVYSSNRPCRTDHGIAIIVPLATKEHVNSPITTLGAVIAIVPVDYLITVIRSRIAPESKRVFDFQLKDGTSLCNWKTSLSSVQDYGQEDLISSTPASLGLSSDTDPDKLIVEYRLVLSEPSDIRFAEVDKNKEQLFFIVLISLFVILILAYFTANFIVSPLKDMKKIVNQYAAGDYSSFKGKIFFAEFANFTRLLERMGEKILDQLANLQEINSAYARFVPNDFLNYLQKESIIEVQLGDHVEKNMSVLFADIADFTTISERMSPKQNFTFVNSILNAIGPIIRNNNGFIDKYIGDAIMALFDKSPDDAIAAGIGLLNAVTAYNEKRKKAKYYTAPIKIRVGINTGHLMLGIIGEYGRMDGTVISDAVNLASRLEGLAKLYGASLVISGHTFYRLEKPLKYRIRELDLVAVKGKSQPVSVFEVLEGDESETMQKKRDCKKHFEKGVFLYRDKHFHRTRQIMQGILRDNPNDKAAQLYYDRCQENIEFGVPENWQAVTRLYQK